MADPIPSQTKRQSLVLPARPFFFTLDQISTMLDMDLAYLKRSLIHYEHRSVGARKHDKILAINIVPVPHPPEWRVAESEFIRWCKFKGIKFYERAWAQP